MGQPGMRQIDIDLHSLATLLCILVLSACETTTISPEVRPSAEAISQTKEKAESGDVQAQLSMARIARWQHEDMDEAIEWYSRAAGQGEASAGHSLGDIYRAGLQGVPKDPGEAEKWYRLAIENGGFVSQELLGEVLKEKDLREKDPVAWERKEQERIALEKAWPDTVEDTLLANLGIQGKEKLLLQGKWTNYTTPYSSVFETGLFMLTDEAIYMFRGGMTQSDLLIVLRYSELTEAKVKRFLLDPLEVSVHHKSEGKLNLKTMEPTGHYWKVSNVWTGGDGPKKVVEIISEQISKHQEAN